MSMVCGPTPWPASPKSVPRRDQVTPIDFPVPPVRKVVTFAGSPEQAFERFSKGIGSWWPLATHSLGREAQALSVGFERIEIGARLIELWRDGQERVWGTLVDVDPPRRLSFTWHVGRDRKSVV